MSELYAASRELPAVVFVNPHAGGGRARKYLPAIQRIFAARSLPAEFVWTETAESLEVKARTAIDSGRRLLFALGGDGTLQALVNAAHGSEVVIGILPAGGGNDFAAALRIPKNPAAALAALLSARPQWSDVISARTADGKRRLYVGGGGLGLDADAANYSASYTWLPARLRYIAAALRALHEFKPLRVKAEFPGSALPAIEEQALLVGALNTSTYGAGLRLAPGSRIDDGLLTTSFVRDLSAAQILAVLPNLIASGSLPGKYVLSASAARVRLTVDRECLFHGDGEILGPAPVELEVLPRAIRVLVPGSLPA